MDELYHFDYGVLITYGEGPSCNVAVFRDYCSDPEMLTFIGDRKLNFNNVPSIPVPNSFKEISEVIDGVERTTSFSPSHVAQILDKLNWAGFCYLEKNDQRRTALGILPTVIFVDTDHYIDSTHWEEISTQRAIELINQHTTPKKEEENAA
ncbi:hypothetical protein OBP_224 [Pseudomonas phage OBP]|uniref:hypothetical protein n=1 Tax=Pseudomonas phage OBP TaxID=1124849 RepID=UPI000240D5C4|nr:hypothetical protein OBP_224 [Pseudomonas phage OBP]AEV89661.1 hypothetical protein OBP_224 [Pseudomonas phage OBP]